MDVSVAAGAAPSRPRLAGRDRPLDSPCDKVHAEVMTASSKATTTPLHCITEDIHMPRLALKLWPLIVQLSALSLGMVSKLWSYSKLHYRFSAEMHTSCKRVNNISGADTVKTAKAD